ncbi:MAG: hypothetical protein US63_C0006G0016 [Candidatus Moranbacteria bacterium GW2011_GWC2_37_8]|nr:MAG: hypothetical protein US63_C0006G0016 [Candidatus Moranbacteria bacterium GW2011_GWC2_37_8]KKQ62442.1 MAG: hypothetical protein US82_C0011G0016 [Parcubacteria group bacterium GW2011_GWC1_38_22]
MIKYRTKFLVNFIKYREVEMRHIIFNDIPHTHEIIINEETATISFSLRPDLNQFVKELLCGTNRHADYFEKECGFSKFIPPSESSWGYGKVLSLVDSPGNSWITWECKLPYKPSWKKQDEISASISDLTTVISLFEPKDETFDVNQFFAIDLVVVKSHDYFNGGSFSFFYSKEVLDFAATIWNDGEKYSAVMNSMKKFYAHLAGKRLSYTLRDDFYIGQYQANVRCPTFRCPGNCACISPEHFTREDSYGVRYQPHNVDSKVQQLTLLAGVIKLANMARDASLRR